MQYGDTRYAMLLREKWLSYLAEHQQWLDVIRHYQASDNEELACYYDWALYQTGQVQQAFNNAKPLWLKGLSQPKACEPLWLAFASSPELTPDWLWQRFEAALANNNVTLAVFLQRYFQPMDKLVAADWLKVHHKPALLTQQEWLLSNPLTARMAANAVKRWLKTDLDAALLYWETHKTALALTDTLKNELDNQVALALAVKQDPRALWRMQQLTHPDVKTAEWKIRLALALQNWSMVQQAIAQLPSVEQQQPVWRYWRARATEALGNFLSAQELYRQLAEDRSFYGFLAADKVGKPYQMADKPVSASFSELEQLANTTDFKVVREFSALNREVEARRQWWFALTKLSPAQLQIAAKLAQSWQWPQIAIMTLVKADYWDDLNLRFPFKYQADVLTHAKQHGLEPALIYGVMRQESMLDSQALSSAGAIGLMQVMPTTGQQIARELGQNLRVADLYLAERNIQLGSYYVNKLIKRFSGQIAPAIAAYNAGPERVKRWLAEEKKRTCRYLDRDYSF
ncbi:transglycosylase SLT domain-containing protein [Methylocucumis oryzae]|uniref:transglycosylase SLT domain-containing protein n=1 Tax=Methylocucumis oryzae TaxID=1632867 RepID=UPI001040C07F|nr:transglycosylase SLT domain-containing protein [Methylocucumis oryzae]